MKLRPYANGTFVKPMGWQPLPDTHGPNRSELRRSRALGRRLARAKRRARKHLTLTAKQIEALKVDGYDLDAWKGVVRG